MNNVSKRYGTPCLSYPVYPSCLLRLQSGYPSTDSSVPSDGRSVLLRPDVSDVWVLRDDGERRFVWRHFQGRPRDDPLCPDRVLKFVRVFDPAHTGRWMVGRVLERWSSFSTRGDLPLNVEG